MPALLPAPARQVRDVGVGGQRLGNLPRGLDLADLDEAVPGLGDGPGDGLGALGLALGADDVGLALLLGLLDDEAGTLGVLLGDLLLLDGLGELAAKGHVGDGDVLEGDVELGGAARQVAADALGDGLALGDELGGVELGDDGLEDLVADGGEDTLVVVDAEVLLSSSLSAPDGTPRVKHGREGGGIWGGRTNLVDLGQSLHVGTVQHPQRQADHLQILAAGGRGDVPGLGPDVEDDAPLQPGHQEVRPLVDDLLLDTREPVEDDGPGPALDVVEGLAGGVCAHRRGDRQAVDEVESPRCVGHLFYVLFSVPFFYICLAGGVLRIYLRAVKEAFARMSWGG